MVIKEKTCNKCNITKSVTEFYTNGTRVNIDGTTHRKYKASCKECEKASIRNNKASIYVKKLRELLDILGWDAECASCGYSESFSPLHFHHIIPSEKSFSVSEKLRNGSSVSAVLNEAEKCALLCANCHTIEHTKYTETYII